MISEKIYFLREESKISQEELAEKLGVSRQAVQKWESNQAMPTSNKLVKLSEIFNVSIDYLCKDITGDGARVDAEKKYKLNYEKYAGAYFGKLDIEYRQCYDEGKDIASYKDLFMSIKKMPNNEYKAQMADVIFDMVNALPQRSDFRYIEPNDLVSIKMQRKNGGQINPPDKTRIADKMKGGWYGRICGCLLGKPIEGIYLADLEKILKRTDNYPLNRYVTSEDVENIDTSDIDFPVKTRAYSKNFAKMPADDDTNYMLIAYEILKRYGRNFTSDDVSDVWLTTQTYTAYCSAEYIAYINMIGGYTPPVSGEYKNVYREWIGAQIRGDVWGYINPGKPEIAAEMAWKDARVSHVKNGIYGEMWASAMIAAAYATRNVKEIIGAGLGEIPHNSRLHEAISKIVADYENGVSEEKCFSGIRSKWDERQSYDWCHVISNAEIVAAALLYGNGDYEKSVCLAVSQAFDTDCNGATVGSVLGVVLGYNALPKKWTAQINDTLAGTVEGYKEVSVSEMAEKTLKFVE